MAEATKIIPTGPIACFEGHLLDMQELVNQPFLEHSKLIDAFAFSCGLEPHETTSDRGRAFVAIVKPIYWQLRRERMKRIEAQ